MLQSCQCQGHLSVNSGGFLLQLPQQLPRALCISLSFLQTDVQKILRNARKLPEKTQTFYKVSNISGCPPLIQNASGAFDGGTHTVCSVEACRALQKPTW